MRLSTALHALATARVGTAKCHLRLCPEKERYAHALASERHCRPRTTAATVSLSLGRRAEELLLDPELERSHRHQAAHVDRADTKGLLAPHAPGEPLPVTVLQLPSDPRGAVGWMYADNIEVQLDSCG